MHKIDTDTAVGNEFVDGNEAASIKATRLNAKWFNTIQRELCKIVESAEIALSDADDAQIVAAMAILFEQALLSKSHKGEMTFVNLSGQTASISGDKISLNGTKYQIEIDATTGEISILSTEFGGFSLKWDNCANITDSLVVDGSITANENLLAKGFIGFVDDEGKSDDYTKIEPGQVSTNSVKVANIDGSTGKFSARLNVGSSLAVNEGECRIRVKTIVQDNIDVTGGVSASGDIASNSRIFGPSVTGETVYAEKTLRVKVYDSREQLPSQNNAVGDVAYYWVKNPGIVGYRMCLWSGSAWVDHDSSYGV